MIAIAVSRNWLQIRTLILIVFAASLAIAPELLWGLSASDSFRYNIVWTDEFARQFANGNLYPRWLSQSWDGLGAPTFYHYPPLFFWLTALISSAVNKVISLGTIVSITSWAVLITSGGFAYFWFKRFCRQEFATFAAMAYILTPYHLYDAFARGALAESTAYAVLPMVLIAIDRVKTRRADGILTLAVSYCLLILAHLPSALLASISIIPTWILYRAWRRDYAFLVRSAIGLGAGIGLVAFYLVPALKLLPYILTSALTSSFYDPNKWAFWSFAGWPNAPRAMLNIVFASAALSVAFAALCARARDSDWTEVRFWAGLTALIFLMIGGFIPFLWQLPGLTMVQFPSRLIPEAELAALTALVVARPKMMHPISILSILIVAVTLIITVSLVVQLTLGAHGLVKASTEISLADRRDDPTYLPAGHSLPIPETGLQVANPSLVELPKRGWLVRGGAAAIRASTDGDAIDLDVEAAHPTRLVARRFNHPRWVVRSDDGRVIFPSSEAGTELVSWPIASGTHHYRLEGRVLPIERTSLTVTMLTLLSLLGAFVVVRTSPAIRRVRVP